MTKKTFLLSILCGSAIAFLFVSCRQDDDLEMSGQTARPESVTNFQKLEKQEDRMVSDTIQLNREESLETTHEEGPKSPPIPPIKIL
ncbi:hypothetical protein [Chryseobacterium flavum]|uniref:hypothetical protein n=1 Tax=Chryseobacterium flavum TaxID=415851 RepID=UPI0028B0C27B|nr:hypothetical protein [Chryseobacterium flavum]